VRKTMLSVLCAILIAATVMQSAVAAERHHARKAERASMSNGQPFRDASKQAASPSVAEQEFEYWQGRGRSAPAGH